MTEPDVLFNISLDGKTYAISDMFDGSGDDTTDVAKAVVLLHAPELDPQKDKHMSDKAALAEIERRIQIVEDNLRELVEQATAYSGAADEERTDRRTAGEIGRASQGARGPARLG